MTDKIQCLICGKEYIVVCGHVRQAHKISAYEYKKMFGLPNKKGIIPDKHRELLRAYTKNNWIAENLAKLWEKTRYKKGETWVWVYERREETKRKLRDRFITMRGKPWDKKKRVLNPAYKNIN